MSPRVLIGCAGWGLPRDQKKYFPEAGSLLERYAARFSAVEINSSFYKPHRTTTYARWAASVPEDFRFAVKIPKAITHVARLNNIEDALSVFLDEVAGLGEKLGCLLAQTPPSLDFNLEIAHAFFISLRARTDAPVALEPRHESWAASTAEALLRQFSIARVAADPPVISSSEAPAGWPGLAYFRLHGAPRIYYSAYSHRFVQELACRIKGDQTPPTTTWCIFDNTAAGAAIPNARQLVHEIRSGA